MLTLLLGGARSGKSSLAVEMGLRHDGPVVFVATAEPFDDDLRARIDRHREERPQWPTIEAPIELVEAVSTASPEALVIVDCLTVWVGNLFHHLPGPTERSVRYAALAETLAGRVGDTVVVSNEVGLGLHPETPLGREYRDELGRLNQHIAVVADQTLLLVAGRALSLTDPWTLLEERS